MKRRTGRLIGILTLLIWITACNPANSPAGSTIPMPVNTHIEDGGLFTSSPCGPPCFYGIQPDVTNYDKVMSILSTNPDLSCREEEDLDSKGPGIKCGNSLVIYLDSDKKSVTALGYNPSSNITVQNVMDKFGVPEKVVVLTGGSSKIVSTMQLFYPKHKMSLLLDEQDGDSYMISSDCKVQTVTYDGEKTYQALTEMAQAWSDFGKYIK